MEQQISENKKQAVGYLLGDLPDAERDRFEERLFLDEDLSLSLDAAENDLVDEYVRGELSGEQVVKFERSFLRAESRREKLQAAKILQAKLFDEKPVAVAAAPPVSIWERLAETFRVPRVAWASGLAAVALFALLGGFWLLRNAEKTEVVIVGNDNQTLPVNSIEQPTIEISPNSNAAQNIEPNPTNGGDNANSNGKPKPTPTPETLAPKSAPPPPVYGFTLLPPIRSGTRPTLVVPPNAPAIRLRVEHNNTREYVKYRSEIRDSSGDLIWSREVAVNEKNLRKPLVLDVRGGALATGAYELTLSGVTADAQLEEINFYNFTVRRK